MTLANVNNLLCQICGQVHPNAVVLTDVLAANSNYMPTSGPRRKITVAESLARTKVRYAETLKNLA